ncbi:uncharacterized protein DNG_02759 [Cephalotrichum gorgonifer]|uniref:Uncharacterized protein n=1 Tax=Cephalotrichum gorgonifer TaxID=2041049 RepID=A0AAE8STD0_9PEZI|nr:uncharacterized protein DNG_02759 [Cephalotrichum gorgonifer]
MADHSEDDDPVVASFNVFINPTLEPHRKIHILHQSVRYDEGNTPAFPRVPSELRVKPDAGVLEVDVPLDMMDNYDRDKGMQYGAALKDTVDSKGGGAYGLAGGFGVGAPPARKGGDNSRASGRRHGGPGDWVEESRSNRVLRSQTLGGIIPKQEPLTYMIGILQGGDLHLTPANKFINLTPQLHHVDALTQLEQSAAAGAAKDAAPASTAPSAPARAIHMTIKNADAESISTDTMADRLRAVQAEPWRKMRFVDENEEEAWDVFTNTFVPLRRIAEPAEKEQAKEGEEEAAAEEEEPKSLDADLDTVEWLETGWTISDIEGKIRREGGGVGGQVRSEEVKVKAEPGVGRAASASARRGRARGSAMEID